jgi:hypothetical protein
VPEDFPHRESSFESCANNGSKKDSVFPEPVPEVIMQCFLFIACLSMFA